MKIIFFCIINIILVNSRLYGVRFINETEYSLMKPKVSRACYYFKINCPQ